MTISSDLLAGVQKMRPAVPSKDYALSRSFYVAVGFEARTISAELTEMRLGTHAFLLQDFYNAELAGNFVMHLTVADCDAWWAHLEPLGLVTAFGVRAPLAPKVMPWGLKVLHLFDPAGVMWMIGSVS